MSPISVVVFDIGETVVREERSWNKWADWLGVSPDVFFAGLGSIIAERREHREVFSLFQTGFDFEVEQQKKEAAGLGWSLDLTDLYEDVLPCLQELSSLGYRLGFAGNQPSSIEPMIEDLALPIEFVATSALWGVAKPSPEFFERLVETTGVDPSHIAYVGDRIDNDVLPAKRAGMFSVFLRRGPWGFIQASWPEAEMADTRIESLLELIEVLQALH